MVGKMFQTKCLIRNIKNTKFTWVKKSEVNYIFNQFLFVKIPNYRLEEYKSLNKFLESKFYVLPSEKYPYLTLENKYVFEESEEYIKQILNNLFDKNKIQETLAFSNISLKDFNNDVSILKNTIDIFFVKTDLLNIVRNINNFKIQRYNDNLIKISSTIEEIYIPMILLNDKVKQNFLMEMESIKTILKKGN